MAGQELFTGQGTHSSRRMFTSPGATLPSAPEGDMPSHVSRKGKLEEFL